MMSHLVDKLACRGAAVQWLGRIDGRDLAMRPSHSSAATILRSRAPSTDRSPYLFRAWIFVLYFRFPG
jgi:hypothetical protein